LNEPVNTKAHHVNIIRDRDDFGVGSAPAGLNPADFAAVKEHPIVPAPSTEGSDLSARFDSEVRLQCLLKRHGVETPLFYCGFPACSGVLNTFRSYTKKTENCQAFSFDSFGRGRVDTAFAKN
jgi:hypothetical protein